MVGKPAPDFKAKDLAGNEIALSELQGSVVLLDFWATWCPPCLEELPNVKRIYRRNTDKDFRVLGISLDSELVELEAFMKGTDIEWPQIFDDGVPGGSIADAYGVEFIPATFLLDRNGTVRYVDLRDMDLERAVARLLSETSQS
jgi:peroxiredoxin